MQYVFGYGSLIWKPPPHVVSATPSYIKGFVRRFAQKSHDHRGTPTKPGVVVTLIPAHEWHQFEKADDEKDIVWGMLYGIDENHAANVMADLDVREQDGYTLERVEVFHERDGQETRIHHDAILYVGHATNPSFLGPLPTPELAKWIKHSVGPSGRNEDYLHNLRVAVDKMCPDSGDHYLRTLSDAVKAEI